MENSVQEYLCKQEPKLQMVFATVKVDFSKVIKSPYVALVGAIIGQKIRYSLAKKLRGQFYTIFGVNCKAEDVLAASDKLAQTKLSSKQKELILRVSKYIIANKITLNKEGIQSLSVINGIGSWTINTTLLTSLQDWDIFPDNDYFLKKRIQRLYNLDKIPTAKEVQTIANKWQPYRSYVCWYLWRWF